MMSGVPSSTTGLMSWSSQLKFALLLYSAILWMLCFWNIAIIWLGKSFYLVHTRWLWFELDFSFANMAQSSQWSELDIVPFLNLEQMGTLNFGPCSWLEVTVALHRSWCWAFSTTLHHYTSCHIKHDHFKFNIESSL